MEDLAAKLLLEREIVFELDRLELADGRLELSGRWFGVQGRRFMRPSLTLRGDEGETRLLADLGHKPWAAENGELWRASFPCDGELGPGAEAELTVAPDLAVGLPVPDAARSSPREGKGRHEPRPERDGQPATPQPTVSYARQPVIQDRRQGAAQTEALSSARAETAILRERLEALGAELEQERARFGRELREAQDATAEAVHGRDEATADRRKAIKSRQVAQQKIEQALAARGKAKKAAEQALAERDEALARLKKALRQRDKAVKALERVESERERLARANEQLRRQGESTVTTLGAPLVMRDAAIDSPAERRHAHRLAVAIAVTSLLAAALAVILILSVR